MKSRVLYGQPFHTDDNTVIKLYCHPLSGDVYRFDFVEETFDGKHIGSGQFYDCIRSTIEDYQEIFNKTTRPQHEIHIDS